jgi:peptidoglycan-associated lipoprotein
MSARRVTALAAVAVLSLALGACGGKKRPPAVTTDPGSRPAAESTTTQPTEPLDSGPGVVGMTETTPSVEDYSLSDPVSGEGGPLDDVHFDYDSATLTDAARATLERHAVWLQARRSAKVTVEGHCDERGTVDYNLALGDQRARAVRDYLVSLGVAADRLQTVSLGKERPLDTGANEAAWARNRRAHFVVSR